MNNVIKQIIFFSIWSFYLCSYSFPPREKYFIAAKKNETNFLSDLNTYTALLPPQKRFYADPILFKHAGINYIFFEDYDYRSKKGRIAFVTIDKNLQFSDPEVVLQLNIHLSFPFIFEDEGQIYMVPETHQWNKIVLYEATNFPHEWEKRKVLIKGKAYADSIIFQHNGYYWIFTCEALTGQLLRIFYSKDLFSEFQPHPINSKNISSRNAGGVFFLDNKLIRPVMDCRGTYGRAMTLNEIILLTPTEFKEKVIHHIEPTWAPNLNGTHAFSINEDFIIYDGKRIISSTEEDAKYSIEFSRNCPN